MQNAPLLVVLAIAILLVTPRDAQAYLDPNTGSMMLQMAAAGLLGAVVTLRLYWQKVKDFFTGNKGAAGSDDKS